MLSIYILIILLFLSQGLIEPRQDHRGNSPSTSSHPHGYGSNQRANTDNLTYNSSTRSLRIDSNRISSTPSMKLSRQSLALIEGIQNDHIITFIISTAKENGRFIRERIIPAARTWMKLLVHVFVVIEDSIDARFMLRQCQLIESKRFTTFRCRHEAYYILARNCTGDYDKPQGLCCKVDASLQYLLLDRGDIYQHTKYVLVGDDDEYYRIDQLFRWLSLLEKTNISDNPIIGNKHAKMIGKEHEKARGLWNYYGCKEIHTMGWYQPFLLNKQAMIQVADSVHQNGITETCKAFRVMQDVGVGVWAWQHQLYHILMPHHGDSRSHSFDHIKPDVMAVHGIKNEPHDMCNGEYNSKYDRRGDVIKSIHKLPDDVTYNQNIAVGCGTIEHPSIASTHNKSYRMNVYDIWGYFLVNGTDISFYNDSRDWRYDSRSQSFVPVITKLKGYETTNHSKVNGDVSGSWRLFSKTDCHPVAMKRKQSRG